MTEQELKAKITETVKYYKTGGHGIMTEMMLREVKGQYIDMATGGDGSCVGNGEIRNAYYEGMPNSFFQAVCEGMGWAWQEQQTLPWGS